jgi:hypothetical protein
VIDHQAMKKATHETKSGGSLKPVCSELEKAKTMLEKQIVEDREEVTRLKRRIKAFTKLATVLSDTPNEQAQTPPP